MMNKCTRKQCPFIGVKSCEMKDCPYRTEYDWIPCSERLPEACGKYLVTMKWNDDSGEEHTTIKATWYKEWDDVGWDWAEIFDVVAWMPLPPAYKEETDE